jgi:hypothetical protein
MFTLQEYDNIVLYEILFSHNPHTLATKPHNQDTTHEIHITAKTRAHARRTAF